jgi:beta-galactosidase
MISLLVIALLLLIHPLAAVMAYTPPANDRVDTQLTGTWKFNMGDVSGAQATNFNDSTWSSVTLPHCWDIQNGQTGGNYYQGIGWYRTWINVAAGTNRRYFLQFDAADRQTDVWVNGIYFGQHTGGFAAFRFDVTSAITPGASNLIAVKVNNSLSIDSPPLAAGFTFWGGIYRMVHLITLDNAHAQMLDYGSSGAYLTPSYNSSTQVWTLNELVKIQNDAATSRAIKVIVNLVDAGGNVVATTSTTNNSVNSGTEWDCSASTTVNNPTLWNGKINPYLYKAYVEIHDITSGDVVADLITQPVGFRTFSVDPNNGFFLNGAHYALHGVNKHQDRYNKGWAISDSDSDQDFSLINEIGATCVRLAHYEHSQHEYDLCDQNGLVTWAENPVIDYVTTSSDPTYFNNNAEQQLMELIRQNYNHPSICFWSLGNEVGGSPDPYPLFTAMNSLAHSEDPTRLTTYADDSDTTLTDVTDVEAHNRYFGWYYGYLFPDPTGRGQTINDFMPWWHSTHPTRSAGLSEYGAGSSIYWHSDSPVPDHTEEYQNLYHESYWNYLKTIPFAWGTFVWNMFDFAEVGRNEGDTKGRNDKGLVTYDRTIKKDAFYWYKANWTTAPMIYITGHTYTNRTSAASNIKVYTNCKYAYITVNGSTKATQTVSNCASTWQNMPLVVGSNVINAYGSNDGVNWVASDTTTWNMTQSIRINAGARLPYTDGGGQFWDVDRYASGGTESGTTNTIAGTSDQAEFQTYRYGNMTYTLPVQPGTYTVYLKLVEPYFTASGQRVFSVSMNGAPILTNYDIYADVGANTAVQKQFNVSVSGVPITLQFTSSVNYAVICAISAVYQGAPTGPSAPTNLAATPGNGKVTLSWTGVSGATSYNIYRGTSSGGEALLLGGVSATTYSDTSVANGTTYYYKVSAVNANGESGYSNEASALPALPNGTYQLTPACATGARLDAAAFGTTNGTNVDIWTSNGGSNQKWTFTNMGSGWYKIQPSYSTTLSLEVYGQGAANGTNVDLWADWGGTNQRWSVNAVTGGYELTPENAAGQALNVNGGGSANGTNVQIWQYGGESASIWTLQ